MSYFLSIAEDRAQQSRASQREEKNNPKDQTRLFFFCWGCSVLRLSISFATSESVGVYDSPPPPDSDYESLPSPIQLWSALGDKASTSFMHSQLSLKQYEQAVKLFHARLGLTAGGPSPDQLLTTAWLRSQPSPLWVTNLTGIGCSRYLRSQKHGWKIRLFEK